MNIKSFDSVVQYLARVLGEQLDSGQRVLWLVPGGSLIGSAVEVSKIIANNPNISNLTVTLTDERYGRPGHPDENWRKLIDAGFALEGARLCPVLQGEDGLVTSAHYAELLESEFGGAGYSVGFFGMGPDSHIAGIKPDSPSVDEALLTSFYKGEDFERVTITFSAIKHLDEVVVAAKGKEKASAIKALLDDDVPLSKSPAHILRQLPKVSLFTDYE